MSALSNVLFHRSETWPVFVGGLLFAWMGASDLVYGDGLSGAARLACAAGIVAMFGGARLGVRPVQWAGLATLGVGVVLLVVEMFKLAT